jgi:hypothetical protein
VFDFRAHFCHVAAERSRQRGRKQSDLARNVIRRGDRGVGAQCGDHQERGRKLSGQRLRLPSSEAAFRAADKASPPERLDGLTSASRCSPAVPAAWMRSYFAPGGGLRSAMTGNTALLGLVLGQGHPTVAAAPFVAQLETAARKELISWVPPWDTGGSSACRQDPAR